MHTPSLKIIVTTHKEAFVREEEPFLPIYCGKAATGLSLGYTGDDTGENISARNASYCEQTGLYWAWKNLEKVDYIGLCHYRRYFYARGHYREIFNCRTEDLKKCDLGTSRIPQYFKTHDIILPRKRVFWRSIWNLYGEMHYIRDFAVIESIIAERFPEYLPSFKKMIRRNNRLPQYCMFIMKWSDFDKYCTWLFSILFEAEKRIDISAYDCVQTRIWAFVAEHLLGVFVHHQQLKAKYLPVVFVTDEYRDPGVIRYHASRWKCQVRFWLERLKTKNTVVQ